MAIKLNLTNKIINGSFEYFQRNTSFATIADNTYTADRWVYNKTGTMVHTVSKSSDVPSSAFGTSSLLLTPTTAQASVTTNNYAAIQQRIEGNVLRSFKGKKMVLTFYVKAYKTGTYCVSFRNSASSRSLVKEYTISASNTWEKKTIRITHDTSGSWSYDTGIGMGVLFVVAAGSTLQTSADVWANGNYIATANQVNGVDNVLDTFQIADACMVEDNEGQTRDPDFVLAGRDVFEELQLCQRYYEKSYSVDVIPGTSGVTAGMVLAPRAETVTANRQVFHQKFSSVKRIAPTINNYSYLGLIGYVCQYNGTGTNIAYNVSALSAISTSGFNSSLNIAVTTTGGVEAVAFHWTADAEL